MIRLTCLISTHVLIHTVVVFDVDHILIRECGLIPTLKIKLHIKLACCVLNEIGLCRLDGPDRCIVLLKLSACRINVSAIHRNEENIIIQQQEPCGFFQEFRCSHQWIRIIQNILHCGIHGDRIIAHHTDVCRIQLLDLVNDALESLLNDIARINVCPKL